MLRKKLLSVLVTGSLILGCTACSKTTEPEKATSISTTIETTAEATTKATEEETTAPSSSEETTTVSTSESSASSQEPSDTGKTILNPNLNFGSGTQDEITEKLMKLDRVIGAEKRNTISMWLPVTSYYVIFEMPLDWKDPSKGSFPLRTRLVYVSDDAPNTFSCDGYMMSDFVLDSGYRAEPAEDNNTNYIECEHRFFGTSIPEGLSNDSTDLWEYLTDENAAADFHHIIGQYKTLFSGKWIFTGGSKGGQLTHMQSHFYPDDADIYISYVAPGGCDQDAPGFFDFIYNEIGDNKYGKDRAEKYRNMVLQFQVEAMKLKSKLASKYYSYGTEHGCKFNDFTTPEILYDMAVLEMATIHWQYNQDFFTLNRIMEIDHTSDEFADEVFQYLVLMNDPDTWSTTTEFFAYYVQAAKQNGEHEYDFSFLREALKKEGLENLLTVTEDMEKGLLFKMVFTEEQLKTFTFDPTVYNDMVKWSHTTQKPVIMVYGGADVWYSVRLPDVTDNPNVHIYVDQTASHMGAYRSLPQDEIDEIKKLVCDALGIPVGSRGVPVS